MKLDFYKFTQSVCCSLPFKLNILFFPPGRKTPRRAPIVAALFGDRLFAATPAQVLQQQLQWCWINSAPPSVQLWIPEDAFSPCFAYVHEEAPSKCSHAAGVINKGFSSCAVCLESFDLEKGTQQQQHHCSRIKGLYPKHLGLEAQQGGALKWTRNLSPENHEPFSQLNVYLLFSSATSGWLL